MSETETVEFNEDGELWGAGPMDLTHNLEVYYDVDGILIQEPYYDEESGETHHEAMVHFDGEEYQLLKEYLPIYGHAPSGAVAVLEEDLPSKERVQEMVEA